MGTWNKTSPKAKPLHPVTAAAARGQRCPQSPRSPGSASHVWPWRVQGTGGDEDGAAAAGEGAGLRGPGQPWGRWRAAGGRSPSLVLRLTGTSRGVPGGITQCLPTQVRLQLLAGGSWGARQGGAAAGSATAERCIHHFQPLQEDRGQGGTGGWRRRRRRAPQKWQEGVQLSWSQTELSAEKLRSADFWPLAARGGCRRVSLGRPRNSCGRGRDPGFARREPGGLHSG